MMNRLSRLPRPKVTVLNIFEYFTHERKLPSLDIRIRIRSGFIKHIFGGFFLSSNETMFHAGGGNLLIQTLRCFECQSAQLGNSIGAT